MTPKLHQHNSVLVCDLKSRTRSLTYLVLATSIFLSGIGVGCSGAQIRPVTTPENHVPFDGVKDTAWLTADSLWDLRAHSAQARQALKAYKQVQRSHPKVPALLTRLSRASHFVGTYVESDPQAANRLYESGANYARQALKLDPEFSRVMQESGDESEAAREVEGPYLEPLFWLASNVGRRLALEDDFTRSAHQKRLGTFVDILSQRSDTLAQSGADRFLGVFHIFTAQPNLDSSAYHFDRALSRNPDYLGNRTLRAEYLDVARGDSISFRENLEAVLNAQPDSASELAPENHMEKSRAKKLLAEREKLFP
jgi:tetratricopeptide (TPR) repeat protein